MSAILRSLKSDLLDRRLLPILLLVGLALVGAIAYVVLAGGGSSSGAGGAPPAIAPSPAATPNAQGPALPVSQASANPNAAVAETTDGARYQHKAGSHNPFTPLASPKASTAAAGKSGASSSSGSSTAVKSTSSSESKPSSSTPSGGSPSTPTTPSKPVAKPKPKPPVYLVTVQFGLVSSTPGGLSQLTPYPDLKRLQALPSADDPRILFAGARNDGKDAVFALSREAILKGQAICVPSASQCEAINLAIGQTEELAYLEPDGESVPYELKVVSITKQETATASAARARAARRHRHHHNHK